MILDLFKVTDKVAIVTGAGRGDRRAASPSALAEVGRRRGVRGPVGRPDRGDGGAGARPRAAGAGGADRRDRAGPARGAGRGHAWREFGRHRHPGQQRRRLAAAAAAAHQRAGVRAGLPLQRDLGLPADPLRRARTWSRRPAAASIVNISSRAGEHGAGRASPSYGTSQGGAVVHDPGDGARAGAEGPGERHRAGRRRDRRAGHGADRRVASAASSRTTRRCAGWARSRTSPPCAVYLASPASSWVTGKVFEVDGGVEHPAFTIPVEPL